MNKFLFSTACLTLLVACNDNEGGGNSTPVTFDDPTFATYSLAHFDANGDGILTESEAQKVKKLHTRRQYRYLARRNRSLAGIEYFTELEELACTKCNFASVDLSRNRKLKSLALMYGKITALDLGALSELETLNCNSNALTALDLTKNPKLKYLYVQANKLTALDVSRNPELEHLYVSIMSFMSNQIETLDITQCPKITQLYAVDMTSLKQLRMLRAHKEANILMSVPATTEIIYE